MITRSQPDDELELLRAVVATQREITAHLHQPQHVMDVIAERSQHLIGGTGAVVELLEGDEMVYRSVSGSACSSLGLRLAASTSLSGCCVAERRPLLCADSESDGRVNRDACRRVGVRSMIVVPLLITGGGCAGVLKVLSSEPRAFHDRHVAILATMADFIATSLRLASDFDDRDRRASSDPLTGLANRSVLRDRSAAALDRSAQGGTPVTIAFIDLDGFKTVNDTQGHDAGDRALVGAAEALLGSVRSSDTVARLGGDEFVVLAEGLSEVAAEALAARLSEVNAASWAPPAGPRFSASVGLARSRSQETSDSMLARAYARMYAAKQSRHGQ